MTHQRNELLDTLAAAAGRMLSLLALFALFALAVSPMVLRAQTAGEGSITGVVKDSNGGEIANATVTATNVATNVAATRTTSGAGLYNISPLQPGTYTLTVSAKGFKTLTQENMDVVALGELGFNPVLSIGAATETVLVTTAPPSLDTTNATVGMVIENETYANLPVMMGSNLGRDPTAFGTLSPGTESGATRLPYVGGTGNYLGQLYLDGMPAETVSQQGDNRLVSMSMSVDAVDQFEMVTSTPPAEYMGAGAENFTMKSGGLKLHGQVSDFVRNTIFDSWSFTAKAATTKNALGATVPAPKPIEHRNEFSVSAGWKVPHTADKLFFFVAYDKFHARAGAGYSLYTIPTTLMRTGDFTELLGGVGSGGLTGVAGDPSNGGTNKAFLYDPTTTNCVGSACTRAPFQGVKNGVPTYNVIPTSYISPIMQANQQFLPPPTNPAVISNNFLGGYPSGYDNHLIDWRVDYDLSSKQRISSVGAMGTYDYLNNFAGPFITTASGGATPYIGGDLAQIFPKNYQVEDSYVINERMTNQFKYGFTRFYQDIKDETQGISAWEEATLGVTNLPSGQAGQEFFGASFSTTPGFASGNVPTTWRGSSGSVSTQLTTPNNYAIVDNFQWLKGKHSLTFGITYQWQEINNANPATFTGGLDLTYTGYDTANFTTGSSALTLGTTTAPSGYSYASFLLGAVGGSPTLPLQYVAEEGGRYRPVSPFVMDSWKVSDKLTLDLGLRWDYLPPYREVKDHWTFLNPTMTNAATGTPGQLEFAGNYGGAGVSCNCRTPVNTYWKNWGPRIGIAYSMNDKTVVRLGFGEVFSQAGGVGGRGGAFNGTGQTGFNTTAAAPAEVTTGSGVAPSFYLNNGTYFTGLGMANTALFGAGYVYPAAPAPGSAAQILNAGNYVNSSGKLQTASTVAYADPYVSGRAPELNFYNAGIERAITKDLTLAVNYVGDQSHFIINSTSSGANARGYWVNQLNPVYLAGLGGVTDSTGTKPILIAAATAANVAKAQSVMPNINIPAYFQAAAAISTTPTIAQGLVAFPQYSGVTDTWGENVGNFSYNSLQITLIERTSKGVSFNFNYSYSKNIGDDGSFRSGFDIPAAALSSNGTAGAITKNWKQDRIDRSITTIDQPQVIHAFGVWELPFGKGHIGSDSFLVRTLAGGWQLSGIYTYSSGTPMVVTSSLCSSTTYPGQGQCQPDLNWASNDITTNNARIHGSYGSGPNGFNACNLGLVSGCTAISYVDVNAFRAPAQISPTSTNQYLIGTSPRTRPLNLWNPGTQNFDASLHRSFPLPKDFGTLIFEADCTNVWNKVTFSGPSGSWSTGSATFGQVTGIGGSSPRDWQFAAHIKF
jgi:hypothetical protein